MKVRVLLAALALSLVLVAPAASQGYDVNGDPGEWLPTDYYAPMCNGNQGECPSAQRPEIASLYIHFTGCDSSPRVVTLYVKSVDPVAYPIEVTDGEQTWVKVLVPEENPPWEKQVDADSGDSNSPPDFRWVLIPPATDPPSPGDKVAGWEASFVLPAGATQIEVHTRPFDPSNDTTSTREIPFGCSYD